ncbi:hypothetical protein ACLQ2S_24280 [Micromonospora sp. DT48]|uniref:hypothetical protein n=1 Tax=Micromonospora sp. DT48 TaxID=3393429 RepID=UPI003CE71FEC
MPLVYNLIPEMKDDGEVVLSFAVAIAIGIIPFVVSLVAFEAISASAVRLRPLVRVNARMRLRDARKSSAQSARRNWHRFRYGDHQFNAVAIAFIALVVAILAWLFPMK